jgi:hypothetical protein
MVIPYYIHQTSRAVSGSSKLFRAKSGPAVGGHAKSPGALERLKLSVIHNNGGMVPGRSSAGGLDLRNVPARTIVNKKGMGFLVGEAAKADAISSKQNAVKGGKGVENNKSSMKSGGGGGGKKKTSTSSSGPQKARLLDMLNDGGK